MIYVEACGNLQNNLLSTQYIYDCFDKIIKVKQLKFKSIEFIVSGSRKNWFNQKSTPVLNNRPLPIPRPATCMLCLIPKTNP